MTWTGHTHTHTHNHWCNKNVVQKFVFQFPKFYLPRRGVNNSILLLLFRPYSCFRHHFQRTDTLRAAVIKQCGVRSLSLSYACKNVFSTNQQNLRKRLNSWKSQHKKKKHNWNKSKKKKKEGNKTERISKQQFCNNNNLFCFFLLAQCPKFMYLKDTLVYWVDILVPLPFLFGFFL